MQKLKNRQFATLDITKTNKKGNGVGSYTTESGTVRTVEVPFTIPGDTVQATLLGKQGGIYRGTIEEIITPSADRIAPRCLHFGICGGCRWQQISYELQLKWKEATIHNYFSPYLNAHTHVHPIVACDPPWHYRNKMEFSFSSNLAKDKFLGLIMDSSNGKVLNLSECHLVNPWFVTTLQTVREWWLLSGIEAYHLHHNTGALRTLTVREGQRTGDRLVMLTVSGNPDYALKKTDLTSFVEFLKKAIEPKEDSGKLSLFLRIHQIIKGKPTQFYEMLLYGPDHINDTLHIDTSPTPVEMTFMISPSAFFQPNTRQAERIYSLALQMAQLSAESFVYDLYCGTGTLGMCAAKTAKKVIGIELSAESALDARTNAAKMGLTNFEVIKGDVAEELTELLQQPNFITPDLVIVDPPRAGLDNPALQQLLRLEAKKILYISCNPATQVANLDKLIKEGHYQIEVIQPVDQFPHTVHMENIALLRKSS